MSQSQPPPVQGQPGPLHEGGQFMDDAYLWSTSGGRPAQNITRGKSDRQDLRFTSVTNPAGPATYYNRSGGYRVAYAARCKRAQTRSAHLAQPSMVEATTITQQRVQTRSTLQRLPGRGAIHSSPQLAKPRVRHRSMRASVAQRVLFWDCWE